MMGKVTESIWDGEFRIIPMKEVSHIERHKDTDTSKNRITVVFKHSRFNNSINEYEPQVYLDDLSGSNSFLKDWCRYRSELESEDLLIGLTEIE